MMNYKKTQDVYNILITPIKTTRYSENKAIIKKVGSVIETTQTYYPYKEWNGNKVDIPIDPDMSDFAIGFYEILYKEFLNTPILDENDGFTDKEFAGDTMTSVSKLPILKERYHCLANFWLIPMHIGRTSKSTPTEKMKWSKMSNHHDIQDFIDRFLLLLKNNFETYKKMYRGYFENIGTFERFAEFHFLRGSYLDDKYDIREYSDKLDKTTTDTIYDFMKKRAEAISESKYAEELWDYFFENGLLGYKETFLEPDEYPLNKEKHPYAYECPRCNRIIANDENYSIPSVCDECSKKD